LQIEPGGLTGQGIRQHTEPEIVFPEYGVRYIAINDGVDTTRDDNEFTPLRNWFNEFYARDTSKKIRAVKQAKAQKGERVNGECPYGYLIDPDDKNHLIPDPETAPVVKQIFALYVKGGCLCEIQKWLADNKILTVGALRFKRTGQTRYHNASLMPYAWSDKTIYDMLARQEYLGHTITGKTYKVSYKSKKTKKNPEEKRYFFPNTPLRQLPEPPKKNNALHNPLYTEISHYRACSC